MKKLLLFSFFLVSTLSVLWSQDIASQHIYAEIIGDERLFSRNVIIEIDYGQENKLFADNRIRNDQGKVKKFNSMVDALNAMSTDGWEFVQAYVITIDTRCRRHWLLKKVIENAADANDVPKVKNDFKQ